MKSHLILRLPLRLCSGHGSGQAPHASRLTPHPSPALRTGFSRITFHVTRYPSLVAYAALLVAFFLRVYRLADKNVWWDEGWSIWLSRQDLAWIALRTAADEHPPLHYWMLHFWNMLAGADAFAGRFLSVAFGVLTIALLYRIGKRVGGAWMGVLVALFLAAARFHIWWSQDIKNYTPSIFFAFAAVWFGLCVIASGAKQSPVRVLGIALLRSSQPQKARLTLTVVYALCAALALFTHYLSALVLLALNLYALFRFTFYVLRRTHPAARNLSSVIAPWLIGNLLAVAFFAPWLVIYLQNAQVWTAAPAFDFALFLKLVATVLPLGVTTHIENYTALTVGFATLVVLGCLEALRNSQSAIRNSELRITHHASRITHHALLFALVLLLPPILIYLLSLTPVASFAPKIQARYLLILLPAYAMLVARGIALLARLSRYFAFFAILFVLASSAFVLSDYYAERRLRDEYTTLANTINSFARQSDLVLLNTDQEWPTFLYYLRAPLDWLGAPNGKPMDAAAANALVQRALARHAAVWLVAIPDALATDPQRLLETRIARALPKQFEQTFDDKRLVLFASTPRDLTKVPCENFAPQHTRADRIDDNLTLLGFDLPVREARAGDMLRVVTYWRALNETTAEVAVRSKPFVQAQGARIGAGEHVRIESDFVIPPLSADELIISTQGIELARVRVEPRAAPARVGEITPRVEYRFGDAIHLVGYDLPQTEFRAGESVPITLYWRTDRAVVKSYIVFVHLRGEQFNPKQNNPLWGQVDRVPRDRAYPTTAWLPNEIIPDAYRVPIDARAPAGVYQVVVGLYDAATGARLAVEGGGDSVIVAEIEIVP